VTFVSVSLRWPFSFSEIILLSHQFCFFTLLLTWLFFL
jgi:hypothetical protein